MSLETILQQSGLQLLVFGACVYYGIRLLLLHDIRAIRGKDKPPVREEEKYTKTAGILIMFFGVVTLVMAALMFVSPYIAFAEICVGTLIFVVAWKLMDNKYGSDH